MLSLFLVMVSIPVLGNRGHGSTEQHVLQPEIQSAKGNTAGSWNAADSKQSVVSCMILLVIS